MSRLIVPPGLRHKIKEFEAHYRVAEGAPIMIIGPSGTGKSMFLRVFRRLYQEETDLNGTIVEVNCSHFDGHLARSELFGHARGAFTGAVMEKEGWIHEADGGALVLEEVGELPQETQAKLLTFIETGEFHRVGSARIERAHVRVVAATNNEEAMRLDFRHRFFPFYVPPLHCRRQDVLYYLAAGFPYLIPTLAPWELLALLCYHWPGNVREVERVGRLLKRKKALEASDALLEEAMRLLKDEWRKSFPQQRMRKLALKSGLAFLDERSTGIRGGQANRVYLQMKSAGIDVELLERLLGPYHIGLSVQSKHAEPLAPDEGYLPRRTDQRFEFDMVNDHRRFQEIYEGFQRFCAILWSNERDGHNLLEVATSALVEGLQPGGTFHMSQEELALMEATLSWVKQQKSGDQVQGLDIFGMTRDEVLTLYYEGVLREAGGNQRRAADRAQVKYSTFRDQLNKYGIL